MTSSGHAYLQRSALCSMPWSRLVWRRRRVFFCERVLFAWPACCPGEWHWVDSNGKYGKPTFHRRANLSWLSAICFHLGEIAWLEVGSRWRWSRTFWGFWKKRPLTGKLSKIGSKRIHADAGTHIVYKFREIWPTGSRWNRMLLTWQNKNKISACAPALASARIAPKICQGHLQTIFSERPKFHPNPFTSSGIIAGHVNIVQMGHKLIHSTARL